LDTLLEMAADTLAEFAPGIFVDSADVDEDEDAVTHTGAGMLTSEHWGINEAGAELLVVLCRDAPLFIAERHLETVVDDLAQLRAYFDWTEDQLKHVVKLALDYSAVEAEAENECD